MEYEIRILTQAKVSSFVLESSYADDEAAIRAGLHAAAGRPVEVWRDLTCLHPRTPADGIKGPR